MGNCLKTQLQSVVNNNNLVPFGGFKLKTGVGNCWFEVNVLNPTKDIIIEIVGDGKFTDSNYENPSSEPIIINTSGGHAIFMKTNEECSVFVDDSYQTRVITFENVYTEDLNYTKYRDIYSVSIRNSGVVSKNEGTLFVNNGCSKIEVRNKSHFNFDVSQIAGSIYTNTISIPGNNYVTGNVSSLFGCINLQTLAVNIITDIETLALGWKNNSTPKTVTCTVASDFLTLNSIRYTNLLKVVFTGEHSIDITDMSNNLLAYHDGSTWTYVNS